MLVVEDDADTCDTMQLVLATGGYEVETASNGREAPDRLRGGQTPRLILLDLMMPVMDGWQFREEQANDPTIGMSLDSAMPVIDSGAGRDFSPVTSTYWKPWNVNRGSQVSWPCPLQR